MGESVSEKGVKILSVKGEVNSDRFLSFSGRMVLEFYSIDMGKGRCK